MNWYGAKLSFLDGISDKAGKIRLEATSAPSATGTPYIYAKAQNGVASQEEPNGMWWELKPHDFTIGYYLYNSGETLNYFQVKDSSITGPARELKTLWSGSNWLGNNQSVTLSEKISDQLNGIVLVWSAYSNGTAQDWDYTYTFIPKSRHSGDGVEVFLMSGAKFAVVGAKYIIVNDTSISGIADNTATGTGTSGIKYTNNHFVLRYVYGV
jgi:hypothetical protein